MRRHSWSAWIISSLLALAGAACGGSPSIGGHGGADGGKPHDRPGGTGGSGGGDGGTGGVGGDDDPGARFELEWVRPPRGLEAGGEVVVLKGRGFLTGTGAPRVEFGSNPSLATRVVDDQTIYVEAPPGKSGEVDVAVSFSAGGRAVCEGCYRYVGGIALRG
ncbi:MAG TPA: IPT/TIG domain-containing protein, partial [Vulgatibacter sp.]